MGKEVEAGVEVEEVRDDEKGAEDATSESIESKRREAARAEGAAAGDAARAKVTPTTQTWEMRDEAGHGEAHVLHANKTNHSKSHSKRRSHFLALGARYYSARR